MLTISYLPDDEWHGELLAEARHAGFAGRAFAWFNTDDLRRFVAPLRQWPPAPDEPTRLQGGYFSKHNPTGTPVETHVDLTIAWSRSQRCYRVEARLSEPGEQTLPQATVIRFPVEPAELGRFADAVEAMLVAGGSATLLAAINNTVTAI
ncbi:MAG: hypothetical protein RL299_1139 [Pseudomonadota bacterium]